MDKPPSGVESAAVHPAQDGSTASAQDRGPVPMDKSAAYTPWQITRRPIAVVDDSFDDQMVLRRELGFLFGKMPIITFHSGAGLFAYLNDHETAQEKPWLILLDMHMPRMDGLQTLELLAEQRDYADIPVLVISATENDNEIQTALEKGARGFMHKPMSRYDFMEILNGKDTRPSRRNGPTGAPEKEDKGDADR